jgi:hypothetical protein
MLIMLKGISSDQFDIHKVNYFCTVHLRYFYPVLSVFLSLIIPYWYTVLSVSSKAQNFCNVSKTGLL